MNGIQLIAKNIGDLAVWRVANFEDGGAWFVKSPSEAIRMINALADLDLENKRITDNAFGLVEWDGEEWVEWTHPDSGEDIDEYEITLTESEQEL